MNRKEVVELCNQYGLKARKSLGQNFLCNDAVAGRIVDSAGIRSQDIVLEIGPGIGALTEFILDTGANVFSSEIDEKLFPLLRDRFSDRLNFSLIESDFLILKRDEWLSPGQNIDIIISNLPYYVMTPLIIKCLEDYSDARKMVFMIEEDASNRIFAVPETKSYGPLSVLTSIYGSKSKLFVVDQRSFDPQPQTRSLVISFDKNEDLKRNISSRFVMFVRHCFAMRRKTIHKNLIASGLNFSNDLLSEAFLHSGIQESSRAEAMKPTDFLSLYDCLFEENDTMSLE
ncbi:MAG: ribosomal RNA small subunit methyltransferase A [Clostridiaceae bacterium]|nr:ribosomal RNA small subunit methyltransferase A [Clostridiaceae bacterium]